MENIATCVRIYCFGYSKNIPFELNYESFVKTFMKKFELTESQIKDIYFEINFSNGINSLNYQIKNQNDYYEAFISNECLRIQFSEITGKAIFPNSDIKKKKQSDPLFSNENNLLNTQNIIFISNNIRNNNNINKDINSKDKEIFYDINNIQSGEYYNQYYYNNYNNNNSNNNNNIKVNHQLNINPNFLNQKKSRFKGKINNNQNNNPINDKKKNLFNKKINIQNDDNKYLNQEKYNIKIINQNINEIKNNNNIQYFYQNYQNNNFVNFPPMSIEAKLKKIENLQKEIKELKLIYQTEKKKNEEYKRLNINKNIGLDQINEIQQNKRYYAEHIDEPSQIIPDSVKIKQSNIKKSNLNAIFLNENNNGNIIKKEISEIEKLNPIKYIFKILKKNINEYWPKDILLFCIPNDSNIYFKHIKLNDFKKVKSYKKNNNIYYEINIDIQFKKIRKVDLGDYILEAKLISDSNLNLCKSVWKIIVRIIEKDYNSFSIFN